MLQTPSATQSDAERRGARFLASIGPVGVALGVWWLLFYGWHGYPWPALLCNATVVVAGGLLPLAVRWRVAQTHVATVAALALASAVIVPLAYTGGVRSFNAIWLLVVPYVAVVGGARNNWPYLMGIAAVSILSLAGLETMGRLPDAIVPFPVAQPLFSWLSAIGVMTYSILVHHGVVETAIAHEKDISASLMREVDEHQQTQADLETTQRDLIDAARLAGMAEVAHGVLHNVGNGLNTVNVGVGLLAERTNPVQTDRLTELASLIEHPKTSRSAVANYLRRVATVAAKNNRSFQEEVERLRHQVQHVNTIVQAQQDHARHGGMVAEITLSELLNDTLLLVNARLTGIAVHVDRGPDALLAADRHKTMLVLLNLLNNAIDATQNSPTPTIHVGVHTDNGHVVFQIGDNGVGIAPDNLKRIFQHGYTTKPDGNGFGLHSSALTARELGGHIEVDSPGSGYGATFTFTLPLNPIRLQQTERQTSQTAWQA